MIDEKPRAYSYLRMSTDVQLKGDSLRRQIEASRRYAEQHNLSLQEDWELKDIGLSAYRGDHLKYGALGGFVEGIKEGQIPSGSYLLIESFDRLSRQEPIVALQLFIEILKGGIFIVTLFDEMVFSKEMDVALLMASIGSMGRAHEESATKSRRMLAAWANKRAIAGEKKLTSVCPLWLKLSFDRKIFIQRQKEVDVIKRIFKLCANGVGVGAIESMLNREGVPTLGRAKLWHQSYLIRILHNRAVLGEFQPHRRGGGGMEPAGPPVPDYFPRIITDELFYACQDSLRSRRNNKGGRKGPSISNLFSHLGKCAYCQAPMRFVNKGARGGGPNLICSAAVRKLGCVRIPWKYKDFESSFLAFVREVDLPQLIKRSENEPDELATLKGEVQALRSESELLGTKMSFNLAQIEGTGGSKDRLYLAEISKLASRKDAVDQNIMSKERELEEAEAERRSFYDGGQNVVNVIERLQGGMHEDVYMLRAATTQRLREIIQHIEIFPSGDAPDFQNRIAARTRELSCSRDPSERARLRKEIRLQTQMLKDPLRHERYFIVWFRNGMAQRVYPNVNNPLSSKSNFSMRLVDGVYVTQDHMDGREAGDPEGLD